MMKLLFKEIRPPIPEQKPPPTVVFIDCESLFISFAKHYSASPDLAQILEEIKSVGRLIKIKAFGDFTLPNLKREQNRVRTITSEIINCSRQSQTLKKDFTDFIMLDHIYQEMTLTPSVRQYVLFTGDGHFSSAATFLRTFKNKTVGVYGVAGSMSSQLKECATWAKEIYVEDDSGTEYKTNLIRNLKSATEKGIIPTFLKTVEHTVRYYGGDQYRYEETLRELIEDGYIESQVVTSMENREFKMLVGDWDKIEKDFGYAPSIVKSIKYIK